MRPRPFARRRRALVGVGLAGLAVSCLASQTSRLVLSGEHHQLRKRSDRAPANSPNAPPLLVVALDGISRGLLYQMLRAGELPNLATLVGGEQLAHAYLDDSLLSTLPSTTMAAWVTAMTGVTPAEHGVTGNEFFVRETRTFACPAPVSFKSAESTLALYTDDYLDKLFEAPTVYERIRARDRDALIWVAMNPVYRGADELLLARRAVLAGAFIAFAERVVDGVKSKRDLFATLDSAVVDAVKDRLAHGPLPDVVTLYLIGTDLYAHVADEGPDAARRSYLREVVDPSLGRLNVVLRTRGLLDRLWVMVVSDHGHTAVPHDSTHALGVGDGPPAVLRGAGFRVRKFAKDVDKADPFSAVLAYGGAMAYVYVADRSQCAGDHDACPWSQPPRYREDVLAAADAFHRANLDGSLAPEMKGALDLVLARRPRPVDEVDLPFEVYVGDGKTVPIEAYLRDHPHPSYVRLAERMRELAVGVHGERAGDLILIAHDGDREQRADRFYFASLYNSWHGSPSKDDSDIPLIVANRRHSASAIGAWVRKQLGAQPFQQKITDLMIGLHEAALGQ
jgi:hypothetical protein